MSSKKPRNAREYEKRLEEYKLAITSMVGDLVEKNRELQRLDKSKDEFFMMASHELKTPLTPIRAYTELLLDGSAGPLNEKQKQYVGNIHRNMLLASRLVEELVFSSRMQGGKIAYSMERVDVGDVIDRVNADSHPKAKEKGLECSCEAGKGLFLTGDSAKLEQAITGLVENAIKFTDKGFIHLAAKALDDSIEITVSDSGVGIPKEALPKMFNKFYQADPSAKRKYGGTGLGLYICKGIIEAHNGTITVESEVGKGTTFTIRIPKTGIGGKKK